MVEVGGREVVLGMGCDAGELEVYRE